MHCSKQQGSRQRWSSNPVLWLETLSEMAKEQACRHAGDWKTSCVGHTRTFERRRLRNHQRVAMSGCQCLTLICSPRWTIIRP